MNKQLHNPILGTFVVEEHEGKKYKMMFVEEIPDELTDWEIVSKVSHLLRVPDGIKISDTRTDALFLINYAIREENAKDQTFGPYRYWWTFSSAGLIFDTPVKMINGEKSEVYPYQFAKSKSVIRKVVEKLGVDIFRIAAGVKKDNHE